MPMTGKQLIEDDALTWVARLRDRDFDDWAGFEQWLEASPEHAETYHALASLDRGMDGMVAGTAPPSRERRRWAVPLAALSGVAAAVVALVSAHFMTARPDAYDIVTKAGQRREIGLSGGTSIRLNGETVVRLKRDDLRSAELVRGQALFAVRHDEARPFRVRVGDDEIIDVGTRFDVLRADGATEIAVAEGSVRFQATGQSVALRPGDVLRVADVDRVAVRSTSGVESVGGWQRGRFAYSGEPLSRVAADISRYAGSPVRVSPDLASRPFSGTITVIDPHDLSALGPLFRAQVRRRGGGWLISPQ
jgi:transmembrane sensor